MQFYDAEARVSDYNDARRYVVYIYCVYNARLRFRVAVSTS